MQAHSSQSFHTIIKAAVFSLPCTHLITHPQYTSWVMQLSSMSPRKRHSSGTVITINHNLLPVYMSLSTPCFNFIKHNQVFCTPLLSLSFRNLFLFPPKSCFTFCFPIHPLIFHSQHHSTVLLPYQSPSAHPGLTATLQNYFPGQLQVNWPLESTWSSGKQPQRASCYCQVKQDYQDRPSV